MDDGVSGSRRPDGDRGSPHRISKKFAMPSRVLSIDVEGFGMLGKATRTPNEGVAWDTDAPRTPSEQRKTRQKETALSVILIRSLEPERSRASERPV